MINYRVTGRWEGGLIGEGQLGGFPDNVKIPALLRPGLQAVDKKLQREIKEAIDTGVREGVSVAKRLVHEDSGRLKRSIHALPVRYRPGGQGGGGFYEAGMQAGGTEAPHAKWYYQGTGIYGPKATPIIPRTKKFMVFKKKGEPLRFRRSVKGQRPKQQWWDQGRSVAVQTVRAKAMSLDIKP